MKLKKKLRNCLLILLLPIFIFLIWRAVYYQIEFYSEKHEVKIPPIKTWLKLGLEDWREESKEILSPVYVTRRGRLKREDIAFIPTKPLRDFDFEYEFSSFAWPVTYSGVIFKAKNHQEYYVLDFYDLERKGPYYQARLWLQKKSGFRIELASALIRHRDLPMKWTQQFPSPHEWEDASPGWTKIKIKASGTSFRVFANDKLIIRIENLAYLKGNIGLIARGPAKFRKLKLSAEISKNNEVFKISSKSFKRNYFFPIEDKDKKFGMEQTYPGIIKSKSGKIIIWTQVNGRPTRPSDLVYIVSNDNGKSWSPPSLIKKTHDLGSPRFLYLNKDEVLICLYTHGWINDNIDNVYHKISYSKDFGRSWTKPKILSISGIPINKIISKGAIYPYAPMQQLTDGSLIQSWFHEWRKSGVSLFNSNLGGRSLFTKSYDGGFTWEGPFYVDYNNTDSNETMFVETKRNHLIAFSRTLSSKYMWISKSNDGGRTWSKQNASNVSGEVPYLLKLSSGVIIMANRGPGIFLKTSIDGGHSWSSETRVTYISGMMSMVEVSYNQVLIVYHESYWRNTRIRAQIINVDSDGTLSPK